MELNKYENYEIITISRKDIKNAPYNPRKISDKARTKIKNNIKKVGLLTPIVWNKATGNIVSGHQRIGALDLLSKTKDYNLRVAAVELDEKTEKEQNIFFNNPEAQGEFDIELLGEMYKANDIDFENTGFEVDDIFQIFGKDVDQLEDKHIQELADRIKATAKARSTIKKKDDDVDYYAVFIFKSNEVREGFMEFLGVDDNKYQNGQLLMDKLGYKHE